MRSTHRIISDQNCSLKKGFYMAFYFFSCVANFASSLFISLYFLSKRSQYKEFILFNISLTIWSFFCIFWILSRSYQNALLYSKLLYVGATLVPFFFSRFTLEFVNKKPTKFQSIINAGLVCVFIILIFISYLLIKDVSHIMYYRFWP